jgi:hypothetical protein
MFEKKGVSGCYLKDQILSHIDNYKLRFETPIASRSVSGIQGKIDLFLKKRKSMQIHQNT